MSKIKSRINDLLKKIEASELEGYLIPSNDEFQSEYVPEELNRLKYITGFTGSNGLAIISKSGNYFFTDGRYKLQAKNELDESFKIYDISELNQFCFPGKLGFDPKFFSLESFNRYSKFNLVSCNELIEIPSNIKESNIFNYPLKYSGKSKEDKCSELKDYLNQNNLDAIVITDSASICWLLNIRANDVAYNPILLSYLIFYNSGEYELFSNSKNSFSIDQFSLKLDNLKNKKVQIDPSSASVWVRSKLVDPVLAQDPCILKRACKNEVEIKRAKEIHTLDAIALCKFLHWFESSKTLKTESSICNKLLEFRQENKRFLYPSFATIAGFKENGAIIHYQPKEKTSKSIEGDGLLLIDSGGQYFGGTTDITRTIVIGKATKEQKENYTLVLKGHIALAQAIFPIGTKGADLDILARQYLWQKGLDYAHSTGHGVGNCLSVHETPPRIGKNANCNILANNIISNEPGFYKEGEYGIRLENLLLIKEKSKNFLSMETLSLAPFESKLIIPAILSNIEKKWINDYHRQVYNKVSPHLNSQQKLWLRKKTKCIA